MGARIGRRACRGGVLRGLIAVGQHTGVIQPLRSIFLFEQRKHVACVGQWIYQNTANSPQQLARVSPNVVHTGGRAPFAAYSSVVATSTAAGLHALHPPTRPKTRIQSKAHPPTRRCSKSNSSHLHAQAAAVPCAHRCKKTGKEVRVGAVGGDHGDSQKERILRREQAGVTS